MGVEEVEEERNQQAQDEEQEQGGGEEGEENKGEGEVFHFSFFLKVDYVLNHRPNPNNIYLISPIHHKKFDNNIIIIIIITKQGEDEVKEPEKPIGLTVQEFNSQNTRLATKSSRKGFF